MSTLRYSETFHSLARNTFDLIFFSFLPPFLPPSHCRRVRGVGYREGGEVVVELGYTGNGCGWERENISIHPSPIVKKKEKKWRKLRARVSHADGIGRNSTIGSSSDHAQEIIKSNVQCVVRSSSNSLRYAASIYRPSLPAAVLRICRSRLTVSSKKISARTDSR